MTYCNELSNIHGSMFLRERCSEMIVGDAVSTLKVLAATGRVLEFGTYNDMWQLSAVHRTLNGCFHVFCPEKETN